MKAYYDRRAPEYDDWVFGKGFFADRERPGWDAARERLEGVVSDLPPARTLDVGCGTGWLTKHLRGEVVGLDASDGMLAIAHERVPDAEFVVGDALELPFADESFDRVLTGHFYGHLEEPDRVRFLAEARRVAPELVVVDSAPHGGLPRVEWQERELTDGSRWEVYKRFFSAQQLADELGGGETLLESEYFVVVRSPV